MENDVSEEYKHNRRTRGWTFNKELSVGDIFNLALAALAVVTAYFALDKRITVIETTQQYSIAQASREREEIKAGMLRLEEKMDRLLQEKRKTNGY